MGLERTVTKLIDVGADVNYNTEGCTPLKFTCYNCKTASHNIVKELIKRGANVNLCANHSVLFVAYSSGCSHSAITLIDAGANFVDILDRLKRHDNNNTIVQYIKGIYTTNITATINDDIDKNNAMATSFRKTYVPGIIDMIVDFIL